MAVNGTHNVGEEWKQKTLFRQDQLAARVASIDVGLYNDSTDALVDADDLAAITTEPSTGNYARQSASLDTSTFTISQSGGDIDVDATVTFDVTDTGETVDGFFTVVNFQSDVVNAEGAANDHILTSATFGTTDLSNYTSIDVTLTDTLD